MPPYDGWSEARYACPSTVVSQSHTGTLITTIYQTSPSRIKRPMKHHLHIKTFKKPVMLEALLLSLEQHGYVGDQVTLTVGDDNPGESLDVLKKFNFVDAYLTGNVHGIWANNNRGIKYFLEESDADALLVLDNDIQFTESGMLEELENANRCDHQEHITGFVKGLDGVDGLQVVFRNRRLSAGI
jgi:hypothetical protein